MEFFEAFPFFGLRFLDEGDRVFWEEGAIGVEFFVGEFAVAMLKKMGFDDLLEGCFSMDAHRYDLSYNLICR